MTWSSVIMTSLFIPLVKASFFTVFSTFYVKSNDVKSSYFLDQFLNRYRNSVYINCSKKYY